MAFCEISNRHLCAGIAFIFELFRFFQLLYAPLSVILLFQDSAKGELGSGEFSFETLRTAIYLDCTAKELPKQGVLAPSQGLLLESDCGELTLHETNAPTVNSDVPHGNVRLQYQRDH